MPRWEEAPLVEQPRTIKPLKAKWESAPLVEEAARPGWSGQNYVNAAKAVGKSLANTAIGFTNLVTPPTAHKYQPLTVQPSEETAYKATNAAQFLVPVGGLAKGAAAVLARGAGAGVLTKAQGGTAGEAVMAGGLGALPIPEAIAAGGRKVGAVAGPLVRAALKPTVASMQRVAGAAREGINAKAQALVRFVIDNRVTTAEKARSIFRLAEHDLQLLLKRKDAPTDAPTRALRYLEALERSAAKQALPAEDVAIIRKAAEELMGTGLGEDVTVKIPAVVEKMPVIKAADVETFLKGTKDLLGKGLADKGVPIRDDAGRIVRTAGGVSKKLRAGIDLPDLKDISASQAKKAIEIDGDNPTYQRIKRAVMLDWEEQLYNAGKELVQPEVVKPASEKVVRQFRTDVTASEALGRARANSKWDSRKAWGEMRGAKQEASKAVERALRDSVKDAVPESREILRREGLAIQAEKALDRAEFRAANRDVLSLPAHVIAAGELAAGKPPKLAFLANWVRDNQLKLGIYADRLEKAVERGHWPEIAFYLQKAGVGVSAQGSRDDAK